MNFNEIEKLLEKDPDKAVDEMLSMVKQYYGEVPHILEAMRNSPNLLLQKMRYETALNREMRHLDPKIIELITIAVAAALRCTHCLKLHTRVAQRMGATREEIFDTVLLAASIANASVFAEGTRALDQETETDVCDTNDELAECDVCPPERGSFAGITAYQREIKTHEK